MVAWRKGERRRNSAEEEIFAFPGVQIHFVKKNSEKER